MQALSTLDALAPGGDQRGRKHALRAAVAVAQIDSGPGGAGAAA